MLIPIISALADAGGVIIDKIILARRRVALHVFIPVLFLFLFGLTVLMVPLLGRVDFAMATDPAYIFLFLIMIALAITWNIFYYQSIQKEKLYEHELIMMLTPAVTILLASVFFPERFDLKIFIAAAVAALALIISRLEKEHFAFDQYSFELLLGVMLMSLEVIVINELLQNGVYSPVSLYALRTGVLFLFFLAYFHPRLTMVAHDNLKWILASALLGVVFMILRFYAYKYFGVVHTTLVLIASPLLVNLGSTIILKERIKPKIIVMGIVILICIVYATILDAKLY